MLVPKVNQDSFKVIKGFPADTKTFNWLFEMFDGHGPHGEIVSNWSTNKMPELLDSKLKKISDTYFQEVETGMKSKEECVQQRNLQITELIEGVYNETDELLKKEFINSVEVVELSGCTGSILIVQEDYFIVANVGDSPIVLFQDVPKTSQPKRTF